MKASAYTFTLILLILGLSAVPLRAQIVGEAQKDEPPPEPAVEITEMQLLGTPIQGATVRLRVRFRAHVDGPGELELRYPKHIAPPGREPGEMSHTEPISLTAGTETVKTFPFRVEEAGASMVAVIIQAEEVPQNYNESASEHINVVSGTGSKAKQSGLSPRIYAPSDTTRRRVAATKDLSTKVGAKDQSNYTVSVNGKITFEDQNQSRIEGLYGSKVELWFWDTSGNDLYHPVSGNNEHVHYDRVAEDGSYHFDFNFTDDLSGYDKLVVLAATKNPAANLSVSQGAWSVGGEVFFSPGQGVVKHIVGMGTDLSFSSADAEINSQDGAILRNMMLSREFVEERYDNSLPFSLPPVSVYRDLLAPPDTAGVFCEPEDNVPVCDRGHQPYIKPTVTGLSHVSHEYGHYVNYRMWGGGDGPMNDATSMLKEGWSIFYSFAVRNYANGAYGDELQDYDDNTEVAPFRIDSNSGNRFDTVTYAENGSPSYAAYACYLWNLYDSYSGDSFEVYPYDLGDNDDVNGRRQRVFEVFRTLHSVGTLEGILGQQIVNVPLYRDVFKNGYDALGFSPLNGDVETSVSKVENFMFSNYTSKPNTPMRPPQAANLSGSVSGTSAELEWDARTYPASKDYANPPDGYKVYRNGAYLTSVSSPQEAYSESHTGFSRTYRVEAYNSAGTARGGQMVEVEANPVLYGTSSVDSYEEGTWNVSVSSGSPRENVQGESNYHWSGTGAPSEPATCDWMQCSFMWINPFDQTLTGTVGVDVDKDGETVTATKEVTVAPGCEENWCPPVPDIYKSSENDSTKVMRFALPRLRAEHADENAELTWSVLPWATLDRYTVQHRDDSTDAWMEAGVVGAADSVQGDGPAYRFRPEDLSVGTHQFRLRFEPEEAGGPLSSRVVTATVKMTEAYRLSAYPNPVRSRATIELAVREKQDVTVSVYDVLGRQVATLHDGPLQGQETTRLSLSASQAGLSSGTYFVRVRGEAFADTRRLTVVR